MRFYALGFCTSAVCAWARMNIGAQLQGSSPYWLTSASALADRDTHVLICFCFQVTLHPPFHLQQLFPPPPHSYSTFSAVLIYRPLRFSAWFFGEGSVLVSDLRSPVLLIPGDFNLHMDVTSDTHCRIHSVTWFSPAVSARFLHLLWRVLLVISLTLWVSLSAFEVTHLFSNIEVHLLYPWCSSLLSCLFWELVFFTPCVTPYLKQVKVVRGVQGWFPDSPVKILIMILHVPHCWFPQGKKHKCLDEKKICNFAGCEKDSLVWNLHICESSNLYSYICKMVVSLLAFFLQILAITILQCIWGL